MEFYLSIKKEIVSFIGKRRTGDYYVKQIRVDSNNVFLNLKKI